MGLLDALTGGTEIKLTPKAGMLVACISMVAADGSIDDDEIAVIRRLDGTQSTTDWEMAVKFWKRAKDPIDCVAAATEVMDEDQRRCTLANLIDIAMADGDLAGDERILLEQYIEAFGVEEGFVKDVAGVISVKNNITVF